MARNSPDVAHHTETVLVLDAPSVAIVSSLLSMTDITSTGCVLIEQLERNHGAVPKRRGSTASHSFHAIYLISPKHKQRTLPTDEVPVESKVDDGGGDSGEPEIRPMLKQNCYTNAAKAMSQYCTDEQWAAVVHEVQEGNDTDSKTGESKSSDAIDFRCMGVGKWCDSSYGS